MKTALAPTVELATPKVEKFVNGKLLEFCGTFAILKEFYTCNPPHTDLEDRNGERWTEGNWGVKILADKFSSDDFYSIDNLSTTIKVNEVDISASGDDKNKIELHFWLSARVMR